jgi:hypothetical protein
MFRTKNIRGIILIAYALGFIGIGAAESNLSEYLSPNFQAAMMKARTVLDRTFDSNGGVKEQAVFCPTEILHRYLIPQTLRIQCYMSSKDCLTIPIEVV